MSFYVYPLVNALHILSVGATVTVVMLMDLRILGLAGAALARDPFLHVMREAAALAFPVAALTGLALFSIRAQEYATNPAFQLKLALLVLAGLNLLAFRRLARREGAVSPGGKVLAAVSIVLWLSILVCGRFIGFV